MVHEGKRKNNKVRARDLGIPFEGNTGALNAITDVKGVEVGHSTIVSGHGKLEVGRGPVRTGVTAVFPRGKRSVDPCFAGYFSLNGNGELTGTAWIEESGFLVGPVMITNTHSVGTVRDAVIAWQIDHRMKYGSWSLPVVAETYDGYLNDIDGFHVKRQHVFEALDQSKSGKVEEGNVGGGTGMICYEFKGGIGTASRKLQHDRFTVGVLAQCNHGLRYQLQVAGVPVGREIPGDTIWSTETGSIIVIVATDAPLLPHQLKRVARRVTMGLARTGSISMNGSGDIFLAFSTANRGTKKSKIQNIRMLPNDKMNHIFEATVQATEEAIINALIAAETMTGINDHEVAGLPHSRLIQAMGKYNRVNEMPGRTQSLLKST